MTPQPSAYDYLMFILGSLLVLGALVAIGIVIGDLMAEIRRQGKESR